MTNKYNATLIGTVFTVLSLLSIVTFIMPMLTILPLAMPIEIMFRKLFKSGSYDVIGIYILLTLLLVFILVTILFYMYSLRQLRKKKEINLIYFTIFLVLQLFIVHPLVFIIDTSRDWNMADDGQFIFGINLTFPISSMSFFIFGLILDTIKIRHEQHPPTKVGEV